VSHAKQRPRCLIVRVFTIVLDKERVKLKKRGALRIYFIVTNEIVGNKKDAFF